MNRKEINIELRFILDLIVSAPDYGFEDEVLFSAFAYMIDKTLSDSEIEEYAVKIWNTDGYSYECYCKCKEKLNYFKEKYCNKNLKV